jgi:hypothetical protein
VVDRVTWGDTRVPPVDHCLVHLLRRLERTLAVCSNILVAEMMIRGEPKARRLRRVRHAALYVPSGRSLKPHPLPVDLVG